MSLEVWSPRRVAFALGADLVSEGTEAGGPSRVVIDSRSIRPGDLFVGLRGERVDGGEFAAAALAEGAWGVVVTPDRATGLSGRGHVLAAPDPLTALAELALAWRRDLAAHVIGVTGSVGKTTTKDILAAVLSPSRAVHASRANFNTEIGLPLEILAAPSGTDTLVLEMAMRGPGQIRQLAQIAEPDVGVVTNIGPVHLELLGSIEAIARAKGELLQSLPAKGAAVIPAGDELLRSLVTPGADVITFGAGGDVTWISLEGEAAVAEVLGERIAVELPDALRSQHNLVNTLAALAAAAAVGVRPADRIAAELSALRGERVELAGGMVAINDCYNANPLSMAAALGELARASVTGRRVAVLGDMLELGPTSVSHHEKLGELADEAGVEVLVTVGPLAAGALARYSGEGYAVANAAEAAAVLGEIGQPGDLVLVKGSRGVGLEVVVEELRA